MNRPSGRVSDEAGGKREKRLGWWLENNPNGTDGTHCRRCGAEVPARGTGCVCWRCTHVLCELYADGYFDRDDGRERLCPDCGSELPKRKHRCAQCARERAQEKARERQRRKRRRERSACHASDEFQGLPDKDLQEVF